MASKSEEDISLEKVFPNQIDRENAKTLMKKGWKIFQNPQNNKIFFYDENDDISKPSTTELQEAMAIQDFKEEKLSEVTKDLVEEFTETDKMDTSNTVENSDSDDGDDMNTSDDLINLKF